jgi:hypothetical protein
MSDVLKPEQKPRKGWAESAKKAHRQKEDKPVIDDLLDINDEEWEW